MIDVGGLPGTPSTVVDLTTRQILRPGADLEQIAQFLRDME
jgi:tRNA A37 threonylcarbamoyladenosine synthetase subunit TsaC/SUA5/YrdC